MFLSDARQPEVVFFFFLILDSGFAQRVSLENLYVDIGA